jgi:hypothetical protein
LRHPRAIVSPFRELDRNPAFDGHPRIGLDVEKLRVFHVEQVVHAEVCAHPVIVGSGGENIDESNMSGSPALLCRLSCTTSTRIALWDGFGLMNKGAIVAHGDPPSVRRSDPLSEVFAVDLTVGTLLASEKPLVMPLRWLSEG